MTRPHKFDPLACLGCLFWLACVVIEVSMSMEILKNVSGTRTLESPKREL